MNTFEKLALIVNDQLRIAQSMLKDTEQHLFMSANAKAKAKTED